MFNCTLKLNVQVRTKLEFKQGRFQDLSEGGEKFYKNKKFDNQEQKSAPQVKFFFDLKDSKRVKIND